MILLEELGGAWRHLRRVDDAAAAAVYANPRTHQQLTVGSFAVRGWYTELRRIGAAAREMLIEAAARQWQVSPHECAAADSLIIHRPSGRRRTFGSVASLAAGLAVPQQPALKPAERFELIGSSPPRVDIPAKVDGSAVFGIDVRVPGMLLAAIKTCPTLGGKLKSFDDSAAKRMAGYHATVPLADGIILVGQTYWQAKKALDAVRVEYEPGPLGNLDSEKISSLLHAGLDEQGVVARDDGDVRAALAGAATTIEAVYEVPYLAHACMEPMNCTALIDEQGDGEVWCGTQAPQSAQAAAAAVLGVSAARIKAHTTYLGGGFGRRGEADFVTQAMTAAKAVGRPVKLIWSREQDIQHDFYRPAVVMRGRAGLDRTGRMIALDCHVVTASSGPAFGRKVSFTVGLDDMSYAIASFRVTGVDKQIGVSFGYWRSVYRSHNPFMLEGFIDEIAHRAGRDPYEFRRSMLQRAPRQAGVLDLLAQKSDWAHPRPGRHLGIAALPGLGGFVGTCVELSVKDRAITLHRVLTAIDCGVAVDPANIRAQLQSAMVFGLTAALRGEITLARGAVQQSNFDDYPVLRLAEMPPSECYIVPSAAAPGGAGEAGTTSIAPALANALFAATGTRVRSLPLSRAGFTLAPSRRS
jgi:isoquinoline 1-oxidoreductase beta subunit